MRVLLSAYACEPGKGSEPEVGLRMMVAAAERHSVWVLTRRNNVEALSRFLRNHPLRSKISIVGFDLSERHLAIKRLSGRLGTIWYYDRWQRAIESVATELDRVHDFDVVHHITFATYWGRIGVGRVHKPSIVGPVGGAATSPLPLLPILGPAGVVGESARRTLRLLAARASGALRTQRHAAAVIAQNHEAARAIGAPHKTIILPNGLIGAFLDDIPQRTPPSDIRFVYAGRLVGWKGPLLAIRALAHFPSETAKLEIYGSGRLTRRLRREADRLNLTDRVVFQPAVPRKALLEKLASCTALIHPALHDDSPLIIAEALSVGTPVVCLDRAGPPIIASYWPPELSRPVPPTFPRLTAQALAGALTEVVGVSGPSDTTPARRLTDEILGVYERAVDQQTA